MRILLVGYGKMGQLVEQLAVADGMEIAARIDVGGGDWSVPADVAIDFSTADALKENFPRYVEKKLPAVIGTTGWGDLLPAFTWTGSAADLHARLEPLAASGVTEILYAPMGPDIPRELRAFADMARA